MSDRQRRGKILDDKAFLRLVQPDATKALVPTNSPPPLAIYDHARAALAECVKIDEAKDIRDRVVALRVYAQQAKNPELEANAWAIRKRAERRIGELCLDLDTAQGTRTDKLRPSNGTKLKALEDAGISKTTANRYEQLAKIPENEWNQGLVAGREKIAAGNLYPTAIY